MPEPSDGTQRRLFADAETAWPPGLRFVHDWLDSATEERLLQSIAGLELHEARYRQYTARRRVAGFGGQFDYDSNVLRPAPPVPPSFEWLLARVALWLHADPMLFGQLLVAEYRPGTPLGWHRDVPDFESIVGISLLSDATMRLRPYPHRPGSRVRGVDLPLPRRSAYVIEGQARWGWQHSIVATPTLRYSVTLRTPRGSPFIGAGPASPVSA